MAALIPMALALAAASVAAAPASRRLALPLAAASAAAALAAGLRGEELLIHWLPCCPASLAASWPQVAAAVASLPAVAAASQRLEGLGRAAAYGVYASLLGLAVARGAAALFLAWELVLAAVSAVVAVSDRRLAVAYFVYTSFGSVLVLLGLLGPGGRVAWLLLGLGAAVKLGVFPLHLGNVWAYSRPRAWEAAAAAAAAPAGALLLVNSGYASYPHTLLLGLGAVAALLGALRALGEDDMRLAVAYAAAGHGGFVLAAASAASPGAALLLAAGSAVVEPLALLVSGVVEEAAGTRSVRRLGLLARGMPVTAFAAYSALTGLAGAPPWALFPGEVYTVSAAYGVSPAAAAALAFTVFAATVYAARLWLWAFWHPPVARPKPVPGEPPARRLAWLLVLAAASALLCAYPSALLHP